ncbi:MAG TPA: hypothetical protein VK154_04075, partial [Chitinophagales bacterium]|nr:hypothetical protein [Chitinophagales bacterium]
MRLLSFLFLLFTLQVTAQTDHIRVIHKQQRFKSDSGATFIVHWDEVELPNKKAEKTINEVLTLYACNYIRSAHGYEQTTEYSPKSKVVYAKHGFISI